MESNVNEKETERFYKVSYFLIPFPLVAGVIFMGYVWVTKDTRIITYCTVASQESVYQSKPQNAADFEFGDVTTQEECIEKDIAFDANDGRTSGLVRWYECLGTVCGPDKKSVVIKK